MRRSMSGRKDEVDILFCNIRIVLGSGHGGSYLTLGYSAFRYVVR